MGESHFVLGYFNRVTILDGNNLPLTYYKEHLHSAPPARQPSSTRDLLLLLCHRFRNRRPLGADASQPVRRRLQYQLPTKVQIFGTLRLFYFSPYGLEFFVR